MFTTDNNIEIFSHIPEEDLNIIVRHVDRDNLDYFEHLGSGSYGGVYGYKGYAIKHIGDYNFEADGENNDVEVLKNLSHLDCVPKLYATVNNNTMIVERIRGLTVRDITRRGKTNDSIILDEEFKKKFDLSLKKIIESGYSPEDLHESNVMIEEITNNPKIIDVGWFVKHHWNKESYTNVNEIIDKVDGYSRAHRWTGSAINEYLSKRVIIA